MKWAVFSYLKHEDAALHSCNYFVNATINKEGERLSVL
jgi:hypothetical protein